MGFLSLITMVACCSVLLGLTTVTVGVHGQTDSLGFISIDCGVSANHSYIDGATNMPYTSDAQFIATGQNYNISQNFITTSLPKQQTSLRSFPNGSRNCYSLQPIVQGRRYLLRANFLHGNYDGLGGELAKNPILFDLYLDVNLWKTINISDASSLVMVEVITLASAEFISVCLVNTGHGTPFISSLELRPLKNFLYSNFNTSSPLVLFRRFNFGPTSNETIRYPDDRYDRIWIPFRAAPGWTEVSTTSTVRNTLNDYFEAPTAVMQTAVTPTKSSSLEFTLDPTSEDNTLLYHVIMYFSEFQNLTGNSSRQFIVLLNGALLYGAFTPEYLYSDAIYSTNPGRGDRPYNYTLTATSNSTLPPILNALEFYSLMHLTDVETDGGDVNAIMAIKAWYEVQRNWMGDPCAPEAFAWDGLICTYSNSDPPRISTLNLSSSKLTGEITPSLVNLTVVQYVDLSDNNLTGRIPDILEELSSLKLLDLTGNQLSGPIPPGLLRRSQYGFLTLRTDPNLCTNENSCMTNKKKKISTPVIVILSVVSVMLLLVVVFVLYRMIRKPTSGGSALGTFVRPQLKDYEEGPFKLEYRQFTCKELVDITNNFQWVIGKGGFGTVYHGYLEDDTQVAIKVRSDSSSQGTKEFLAEAQHLARIHHKNLVSLAGYCKDGDYLALVYEYMSQGTLQEHLRGKDCNIRALSWGERLRIAVEAAQGLEYLHKGCKPPLIHRDVKTANILLNEGLEAKIADFGLSKAFHSDIQSHVSTAVVGTPGYLDPEYHSTFQLSEKSDVYSFGVVLLELITGQPPIMPNPEDGHIIHWVQQRLARGDIEEVVDARLQGHYDLNSVWKVADVALKCTARTSTQRAAMSDVVMQLQESLALEAARQRSTNSNLYTCSANLYSESSEISQNSALEAEHIGRMPLVIVPSAR